MSWLLEEIAVQQQPFTTQNQSNMLVSSVVFATQS